MTYGEILTEYNTLVRGVFATCVMHAVWRHVMQCKHACFMSSCVMRVCRVCVCVDLTPHTRPLPIPLSQSRTDHSKRFEKYTPFEVLEVRGGSNVSSNSVVEHLFDHCLSVRLMPRRPADGGGLPRVVPRRDHRNPPQVRGARLPAPTRPHPHPPSERIRHVQGLSHRPTAPLRHAPLTLRFAPLHGRPSAGRTWGSSPRRAHACTRTAWSTCAPTRGSPTRSGWTTRV